MIILPCRAEQGVRILPSVGSTPLAMGGVYNDNPDTQR